MVEIDTIKIIIKHTGKFPDLSGLIVIPKARDHVAFENQVINK
jgi:hypothetical protein